MWVLIISFRSSDPPLSPGGGLSGQHLCSFPGRGTELVQGSVRGSPPITVVLGPAASSDDGPLGFSSKEPSCPCLSWLRQRGWGHLTQFVPGPLFLDSVLPLPLRWLVSPGWGAALVHFFWE